METRKRFVGRVVLLLAISFLTACGEVFEEHGEMANYDWESMRQGTFRLEGMNEYPTESRPGNALLLQNLRADHGSWRLRGGSKEFRGITIPAGQTGSIYAIITLPATTEIKVTEGEGEEFAISGAGNQLISVLLVESNMYPGFIRIFFTADYGPYDEVSDVDGGTYPIVADALGGYHYLIPDDSPTSGAGFIYCHKDKVPLRIRVFQEESTGDWKAYIDTTAAFEPPSAQFGCFHKGHLILAGFADTETKNYIYASNVNDISTWVGNRLWQTSLSGPGVTGIKSYRGNLVVFGEDEIEMITGTDPLVIPGQIYSVATGTGGYQRSIVEAQGFLFYVHKSGIFRFDGEVPVKISSGLDNSWKDLNKNKISESLAVYYPDKSEIWFQVELSDATKRTYVYNIESKAWSVFKGQSSTAFTLFGEKLLSVQSNRVYQEESGNFVDRCATTGAGGTSFTVDALTQPHGYGDNNMAKFTAANITMNNAGKASLYVGYRTDLSTADALTSRDMDAFFTAMPTLYKSPGGVYTTEIRETGDAVDINYLGNATFYIGAPMAFSGMNLWLDDVNAATGGSGTWQYYNPDTEAWAALGNVSIGTTVGGVLFAASGTITWDLPAHWKSHAPSSAYPELFWIRWSEDSGNSDCSIDYVEVLGAAIAVDLEPSYALGSEMPFSSPVAQIHSPKSKVILQRAMGRNLCLRFRYTAAMDLTIESIGVDYRKGKK